MYISRHIYIYICIYISGALETPKLTHTVATGEDEDTLEVTTRTYTKARNEHETTAVMRGKLARQLIRAERPVAAGTLRRKELKAKLDKQQRAEKRESSRASLETFKVETTGKFAPCAA